MLNASVPVPFQLDDDNLSETTRLTHRVLDLRRDQMQHNLRLRYKVSMEVRKYLDNLGFIDIETPMLGKSTPEGARDYLVPSRVNPGTFFALPQSPQLFKQLLMVANFDRYYQITKCFRDEDLRADRQPEFTQIDCETSFLTEQEIRDLFEDMMRVVFKNAAGIDLPNPFPVMDFATAMGSYGSDKPDMRVKLQFTELTELMKTVEFKVFNSAANMTGGRVVGLRVPQGGSMPRSEIDAYTQFVGIYGAKGLAYIKVNEKAKGRDGLQSPIVKNLSDEVLAQVLDLTGAEDGDLIFFGADKAKVVNDAIGALRVKIGHSEFGKKAGLFDDVWSPLWVIDFPMFEYDDEADRWTATHHPFTAPKDGHEDMLETEPGRLHRQGLRHGPERLGTGRRFDPYPPRRSPEQGVPRAEDRRRRSPAEVRLPARRPAVRRAAARWPGLRPGPPGHADDRLDLDPRRDRLPEDPARTGSADQRAVGSRREAAEGTAYPFA